MRLLVTTLTILLSMSMLAQHELTDTGRQANETSVANEQTAWQQAKQVNTIDAYEAFIGAFPDSRHVDLAQRQMAYLAWQQAKQTNTEEGYEAFVHTYPHSDYYTRALTAWARLEVAQIHVHNWDNLFNYADICISQGYPEKVDLIGSELYAIANREHDIWKLAICVAILHGEVQQQSALALHTLATRQQTLEMLEQLYELDEELYISLLPADIVAHDKQAIEAANLWSRDLLSDEEAIQQIAPYRYAYEILIHWLRDDLEAHRRKAALEKMNRVQEAMGSNSDYQELRRVLEAAREELQLTRLPNTINSETHSVSTYGTILTADNNTMYVCKRDLEGFLNYDEDIYVSHRDVTGEWKTAIPMSELNTSDNDAPLSVSADGQQLLIFRGGQMLTTHKTAEGWSNPEPMNDNINIGSWNADAMITSDGRAMLFASEKTVPYENKASINIFVSLKDENGEWGEPIDLGPTINTDGTDRTPFLHPDMKTLYFSSDRHGNMGGMDVFVCQRKNEDSWTEWTEPRNLGRNINTVGGDWYYRISTDGETAYFSMESDNQENVYSIRVPEAYRPQPVATVSGKLQDKHGRPVGTEMRWEDLENQQVVGESHSDPTDGAYFIVLPEGKLYGFYVEDPALYPTAHSVDLRETKQAVKVVEDVRVITINEMVDEGIPAPLNNLFFDSDQYRLLSPSRAELRRVAEIIKSLGLHVEISGHTDATGSHKHNQELSQKRAESVRQYLIQLGVNAKHIVARGYAETRPVETNATAAGRQANRRVEIRFVK